MATLAALAPETAADAAAALAAASAEHRAVQIVGAGTKPWGLRPSAGTAETTGPEHLRLSTRRLDQILAHDAGDMTATLQAGVGLLDAQRTFAAAGQMLALDPPTGHDDAATIGGIVATGDCGPLSHRYGGPRDLVVGATVALADGTVARSGGTVIKNVAGYDLAKLFCGSFGTLGLILSVNVRLHPLPQHTATAVGAADDPEALAAAARALAALPAELEALDVSWQPTGTGDTSAPGALLARCAGPQALARVRRITQAMTEHGLSDARVATDDAALWAAQRAAQRSETAAVVRVAAPPARLGAVLRAADRAGASAVVGRVAPGHSYVTLAPGAIAELRAGLPDGAASVVLDLPAGPDAGAAIDDPWGVTPAPALALMRAVKARFDPTGTCNPGRFMV